MRAADPELKFEKYQLPNGLTVILSEDEDKVAELATVQLTFTGVKSYAADEPAGHLLATILGATFASGELSPGELERAKEQAIRALPGSLETVDALAASMATLAFHGLPLDEYIVGGLGVRRPRGS